MIFLVSAVFICSLKYNAIYRSNLLTIPLVVLSVVVLFIGNLHDFTFENIFPILGNGVNETFLVGISNLFAFQGLLYILFLPPQLKDVTILKKIIFCSVFYSALYLFFSVAIILLLFDTEVSNTLTMPLYSAARYIEFGSFFQRLDSIFILIWIISFISYLCITINTCCRIFQKILPTVSNKTVYSLIALLMLIATFSSATYALSTFFAEIVYKYAFFILLSISIIILLVAYLLKSLRSARSHRRERIYNFSGGVSDNV